MNKDISVHTIHFILMIAMLLLFLWCCNSPSDTEAPPQIDSLICLKEWNRDCAQAVEGSRVSVRYNHYCLVDSICPGGDMRPPKPPNGCTIEESVWSCPDVKPRGTP